MTSTTAAASYSVLVVAAMLLFYLAATDLREFKIRNELVLVLGGLFYMQAYLDAGSNFIGTSDLPFSRSY